MNNLALTLDSPSLSGTSLCQRCGKQNREQARFCGYCGRPLLTAPIAVDIKPGIRAAVSATPSSQPAPVTVLSEGSHVPTAQQRPSRWHQLMWPPVDTIEQIDSAAKQAVVAALFCASVTAVAVLLSQFGVQLTSAFTVDLFALIDVGLFGAVAWGIHRKSRIAAVCGLLFYLLGRLATPASATLTNPVIPIILTAGFVSGVRATFAASQRNAGKALVAL